MQARLSLIVKIILFALPVALIVGLVNWYVDPGLIFKAHTYEDQLSDTLLANKNAEINTNFNDRILERYLINKLKYTPHTVILGTSRIMELERNFFCNDTIFNNAVSGARLQDIIAIYGVYAKRGVFPKRVIINMEPTFFFSSTEAPSWVDLGDEYQYMLNQFHVKPATPIWITKARWQAEKLSNLYSFVYFKASLHRLAHNFKQKSQSDKIVGTKAIFNTGITRLSDGSMTYNAAIRNQSAATVLEIAQTAAGKPLSGLTDYKPDTAMVNIFEKFIEFLQAKNTTVVFTIPPYHPALYKEIVSNKSYRLVPENEKYIRAYAAKRNIVCYGSYNPAITHTANIDFMDAYHLKTESLYKVLKPLSGCNTQTDTTAKSR